jgi:hypothetical protein
MQIHLFRTDPAQEIAAESKTLALLEDILRPKGAETRAAPEVLEAWRASGLPLVEDGSLRPGFVHVRPHPARPAQT